MTSPAPLAVALVSGGLDSMVSAAMLRDSGRRLLALSFDYNQRHRIELDAARNVAAAGPRPRLALEERAAGAKVKLSEGRRRGGEEEEEDEGENVTIAALRRATAHLVTPRERKCFFCCSEESALLGALFCYL